MLAAVSQAMHKRTVDSRRYLRHATITLLQRSGLLHHAKQSVARRGILVLTLHRVVPDHDMDRVRSPRGMVLRASLFAQLIEYLAEHTLCISARDLGDLPVRAAKPRILLTFDDGWVDNATVAWPMLKRAGLPMCILMTTGLAGRARPFWPERFLGIGQLARRAGILRQVHQQLCRLSHGTPPPTLKRLELEPEAGLVWMKQFSTAEAVHAVAAMEASCSGVQNELIDRSERLLDWGEAAQLAAEGVVFGSHTVSHALLPGLSRMERNFELSQSYQDLNRHLPGTALIAYPNGDADNAVAADARAAGYRFGFCNSPGVWTSDTHPLLIPRVNVSEGKLTNIYGRFSQAALEYSLFWKSLRA